MFQGNLLLEATGGVPEAALVLRAVGCVKLGDHFAELGDPRLDKALDADLPPLMPAPWQTGEFELVTMGIAARE